MAIKFNKDEIVVSKENGVATVTVGGENAYFDKSPIDKKVLKEVADYNEDYLKTVVETVKDQAKEIMLEDSNIEKVVGTAGYSVSKRGAINVNINKSHTYPGLNGKPDVTKSVIKVDVKDPTKKVGTTLRKQWEQELTDALLK